MTEYREHAPRESLSPRIRRLKRAAASARASADGLLARTDEARPPVSLLPQLLLGAGGRTLRAAGAVVRRHPVSTVLIAGVVLGTVLYHRSPRHERI